ncbi:MAG: hypothetical protein WC325_08185 [Candidatus Bathyarchaeia archaeon]
MRIKISETSGTIITLVGIALMLITFAFAYVHLTEEINVLPLSGLTFYLGEQLTPIIEAGIRLLYLVVMGWIASKVTIIGITVLMKARVERSKMDTTAE